LGSFDKTLLAVAEEFRVPYAKAPSGAAAEPSAVDRPPSPDELRDALRQHAAARERLLRPRLDALAAQAGPVKTDAIYKARPLDGIWATAPYLHNGSVPTLWELLQEPDKRMKVFYVGRRDFDPKNVGFESATGPYKFDTSLRGNSNSGHAAGTRELTEPQKRALLEYLKTL
jgi:hypothetical protein